MKITNIKNKLEELNHPVESLSLGDFDIIGEYTAKRTRGPEHPLYKSVGAFYRANYERGLLIYSLIKEHKVMSFLEIGFGRGYGAICAAKAMQENGFGSISTVDIKFDDQHMQMLHHIFPKEWMSRIEFLKGDSKEILNSDDMKYRSYDMVYIDGAHDYESTKNDWDYAKDHFTKCVLFDDYDLPDVAKFSTDDQTIDCARLIDEIKGYKKELLIMDRRIFFDDRRLNDEDIKGGQVLIENA